MSSFATDHSDKSPPQAKPEAMSTLANKRPLSPQEPIPPAFSAEQETPRIAQLIENHMMQELDTFLQTSEGQEEALKFGPTFRNFKRETLLHMVCQNHPTLDVVKSVTRGSPRAVLEFDFNSRTPLHVATAHGASPYVIHFLIKMNPTAACLRDAEGKTPLHLYCEHCCEPKSCDTGKPDEGLVKGPLNVVVKLLCKAGLESVNVEDADDMTPLEYCISFGADAKVISTLQKASAKGWKLLKERKEKQMQLQTQRSYARRVPSMVRSSVSSMESATGDSTHSLNASMSSLGVSTTSLGVSSASLGVSSASLGVSSASLALGVSDDVSAEVAAVVASAQAEVARAVAATGPVSAEAGGRRRRQGSVFDSAAMAAALAMSEEKTCGDDEFTCVPAASPSSRPTMRGQGETRDRGGRRGRLKKGSSHRAIAA